MLSTFAGARRRFIDWWRRLSDRQRDFTQNIVIGATISIILIPVETNVAVASLRDTLLTWQIGQFAGTDIGASLALIDIDDRTYVQAWHSPFATPRDKLCRLIDYATRGGARVVVVDLELSERLQVPQRAITCDSTAASEAPVRVGVSADDVLASYLHTYQSKCDARRQSNACVPIVLARSLRTSPFYVLAGGAPAHEPRTSFLDPLGDDSQAIAWGPATFHLDPDFMLRGWRLWEPVCGQLGARAVPSAEMLAVAAYNGQDLRKLQRAMDVALAPDCRRNGVPSAGTHAPQERLTIDVGYPLELRTSDLERRFFYRFGWRSSGVPTLGKQLGVVIPAWEITDIDPAHRFDPALMRGKIVVIGGTYADNPDYHRTPLGEMPGTIVLLNAINALLHDDHVRDVPWFLRYGIDASLVVLVSVLYLYLPRRAALTASFALIGGAAVTVGYMLLNRGYFFDPILPALGIQIHELIGGFETWLHKRGTS